MTTTEFRKWLAARIDELDRLYDCEFHDGQAERCAAIAAEAGDKAARLGLADLHRRSLEFGALADIQPVKSYLAECLAACPGATDASEAPMMTEQETIAYLRLDTDHRDPAERLRNLVRRQGLPVVRRGKLRLFRRAAVNAWLEKRK
jgi:excisionase family DNA binding protein